jgi:hypothetical protein
LPALLESGLQETEAIWTVPIVSEIVVDCALPLSVAVMVAV